jgi:hypothetical protein
MDLPINFPSEVQVITEEVRRFQALSPENRLQTLDELFKVCLFLEGNSERRMAVERCSREYEERGRKAVQEFVARHG